MPTHKPTRKRSAPAGGRWHGTLPHLGWLLLVPSLHCCPEKNQAAGRIWECCHSAVASAATANCAIVLCSYS